MPSINIDSGAINTSPVVCFTIENDGSVSAVKIVRRSMPTLDSAVVRCIRGMPPWEPGILNGKPVGGMFQIPVIVDIK